MGTAWTVHSLHNPRPQQQQQRIRTATLRKKRLIKNQIYIALKDHFHKNKQIHNIWTDIAAYIVIIITNYKYNNT